MKKKLTIVFVLLLSFFIVTFVACNKKVQYTLCFIIDGVEYETVSIGNDGTVNIPENPTKVGYEFGGWFIDKDICQQEFTSNSLYDTSITNNLIVYAKWNAKHYTVTFDTNGGNELDENTVEVIYENEYGFPVATKEGSTFQGWNTAIVEGNHYDLTGVWTTIEDITLYAIWSTNQYIITYECNGGNNIDIMEFDFASDINAPENPEKLTYTFDGWYTDNNTFNNKFDFTTMPSNNLKLYAKWYSTGLNYKKEYESYTVSIGTATSSDLIIPSVYQGLPVSKINYNSFKDCSNLTSIYISNSVTYIGNSAFANCSSLTSIFIPSSVTYICSDAFANCTNLSSLNFEGNQFIDIEGEAFANTAWFNNQPDGLVYAGNVAYKYKGDMPLETSLELLPNTIAIADDAFTDCINLISITMPNGLTNIGYYSFYGCSGLTLITIPDSVLSIGDSAFEACTSLLSIVISEGLTYLGEYAFDNTLWYNNQPDGLVYAGNVAYIYKGDMPLETSLELLPNTIGIASGAFAGCVNMISVDIPESVQFIGNNAFCFCPSLTLITIPNSVSKIEFLTFCQCINLVSINMPETLTTIGFGAFSNCINLSLINIPNGIKYIEDYVFENCSNLNLLNISESVIFIGGDAFIDCTELSTISITAAIPPVLSDDPFENLSINSIYVPSDSVVQYKEANFWSNYADKIYDIANMNS